MSDYTPTTSEVRGAYVSWVSEDETEFDNWLEQVKAREQQATEQHIIKLLEAHWEQKFADNFQRNDDIVHEDICKLCEKFNGLGVAIALIKGESEPVGNSDKLEPVSKSYELGENK